MQLKTFSSLLIAGLIAAPAAFAQTVEECRELTERLEDQLNQIETQGNRPVQNISQQLELAENEAAKGNGPKCMEIARSVENAIKN